MKCLFVDIASHTGFLACSTEEEIMASTGAESRISDAELIPLVEDLLKKAGWSYKDLTQIACIVGPGGFTSLRVGVTFANVLADQLQIPSAGIHLSDLYRARSEEVLWLHSTKKTELFVRGGMWNEPTLISLEDFQNQVPQELPWMGELIEEHEKIVNDLGLKKADLADLPDVLPEFLGNLQFDQALLHPWYGRGF